MGPINHAPYIIKSFVHEDASPMDPPKLGIFTHSPTPSLSNGGEDELFHEDG